MSEEKLSRKERKALEAQEAREKLEWDSQFAAKQEKKNIEKLIAETAKMEQEIIAKAAEAKAKGYGDVYKMQLSALKVARARKTQAEKFLFQMDTMEKMKNLAKSSTALLGSMNNIMASLGKLSLDKDEMKKSQQNFASAQKSLGQQSQTIEQFFNQMEMHLPDDDDSLMDDVSYGNEALEREVMAFMSGDSVGSNTQNNSQTANDEFAELRGLLNN